MVSIENDALKARINYHGGELTSLVKKKGGKEYIWQADPNYYGRHAPVLFPIVGKLHDNQYTYQGASYHMSQHGIARGQEFDCTEERGDGATFRLKSSPETRMAYPFKFKLEIDYQLKENILAIKYVVSNRDSMDMPFSIGAHPAFNCPLGKGEKRSDYSLVFSEKETADTQLLTDGLRNGERKPVLKNSDTIAITDDLFDHDALIFDSLKSDKVSLQRGNQKVLTVHFQGFTYLGIWSKNRESPFVCIEPWVGIADSTTRLASIEEKEGIMLLPPKGTFEVTHHIEIH